MTFSCVTLSNFFLPPLGVPGKSQRGFPFPLDLPCFAFPCFSMLSLALFSLAFLCFPLLWFGLVCCVLLWFTLLFFAFPCFGLVWFPLVGFSSLGFVLTLPWKSVLRGEGADRWGSKLLRFGQVINLINYTGSVGGFMC